jgi:hypothetical protein
VPNVSVTIRDLFIAVEDSGRTHTPLHLALPSRGEVRLRRACRVHTPCGGDGLDVHAYVRWLSELQMPASSQQQLVRWLMHYPAEIFGARFVRATQRFVSHRLKDQQVGNHRFTYNMTKVKAPSQIQQPT